MQRQGELLQPRAHDLQEASGLGLVLESDDESSSGRESHPSALTGRVEDWRAGVGRSLCSLLSRPFVCECHTISTMPRFQPPPRRTQHADFLALRSPVCFASMLMGPILLERLSAAGGEPCSCRTAAGFRTPTAYSTVSSRSPFGSVPAPCGVESSFPPSLESC